MRKKIDAVKVADRAIRFGQNYPCILCCWEHRVTHKCTVGVKYRGTCEVYKRIKRQLLKMRTSKEEEREK